MSDSAFLKFLDKALQAAELGEDAWRPMSTGEKVSIALALDRADWLTQMGYTIPQAIERADDWTALIPRIEREIRDRSMPHWRGLRRA